MELSFSTAEPFFKGHYPGNPVTPGVVLLDRAVHAAESMMGRKIALSGVKKVKFPNPVLPDEVVSLRLEAKGEKEISYSFLKKGVMCASGILCLR